MAASKTKEEHINYLQSKLKESTNFITTNYSGLNVEEIQGLRNNLYDEKLEYKVIKNNFFRIAWKNTTGEIPEAIKDLTCGPVGIVFGGEKITIAAKILKNFKKEKNNFGITGGFFDGSVIDEKAVNEIAGLPTRDEMLAIIGRGLNTPAGNIARGLSAVISSLARGINAIGEKNG